MLFRVQKNVREWTFTLPNELPFWELESQWILEYLEGKYRGQNQLDWRLIYIIGNLLKHRCLQWACMTHLDIWNTSYGQKKGRESNWQFDSQRLKVGNWSDFLVCRWSVTYRWKVLDEGYNFAFNLISIEGLHTKLWGPKVARVSILGISGLPIRNPGTKCHLDPNLVVNHIIYYKGEGGGFPKSKSWWILWVWVCPRLVLTPKVLQLCPNQLVVWFCAGLCEWLVACHSS